MFEFVFGLLLSWPFLVICMLLAIFSEYHNSNGWAIFFTIVVAIACFFYFHIALKDFLIGIPVYVLTGVVWSFWRYKRYVTKMVERETDSEGNIDPRDLDNLKRRISPSACLGSIVSWIIVWPFSLIENVLEDVIKAVEMLVTTVFKSVYRKIFESAISGLEAKVKK